MRIMSKRKSKRPSSRTSTGAKTGKGMDFFPPLPADDPIFKQGWIVGQTFSGASPKDAQRQNHGAAPRSLAAVRHKPCHARVCKFRGGCFHTLSVLSYGLCGYLA